MLDLFEQSGKQGIACSLHAFLAADAAAAAIKALHGKPHPQLNPGGPLLFEFRQGAGAGRR